jgi:2'-5' RNA ligase
MAPTAIVIPVPEAERAVNLLRQAHTQDGAEGMPAHVTLIYPFTDDSQLDAGRISDVRALLEERPAFQFQLAEVRRFDNLPKESYVWLAPTPSQPFVEMVKALASVFPEHQPFDGAFTTIVPHLTIAASADEDLLDCVASQVADALPIKARAETARIMQHLGGRWRVRAEVSLAPS